MPTAPSHHTRVIASPWPGIHAGHLVSGRHYGRHAHDFYGIGVLEHGAQRSSSGRATVDAHAGDVLAHNPGEVHDGRPLGCEARAWRMVYLEPLAMDRLARDCEAAPAGVEVAHPVIHDPRLQAALRRLLRDLSQWHAGATDPLACDQSLAGVIQALLPRQARAQAPRGPGAPGLELARQRLADVPADAPTLAELAALAGLSRWQLLRRFASAYGVTPHAWLLQRRAERSRQLIAQGLALAQAAAGAGFADQSHMTRVFTRHFGFTPGAWQRARQRPQ
jgi:AraC-like DNA-binding protein